MGAKAVYFVLAFEGIASFVWLICAFAPSWHVKSYYAAGLVHIMTMYIGLRSGQLNLGACTLFADSKACQLEGTHQLYWFEQRLCSANDIAPTFAAGGCVAFQNVHIFGNIMVFIVICNFAAVSAGCGFLAYYCWRKPQKKYRQVAFICLLIAPCLNVLGLLVYGVQTRHLDELVPQVAKTAGLSNGSNSPGLAWAFWVALVTTCSFQALAAIIFKNVKSRAEDFYEQEKERRAIEAEMAADPNYGGEMAQQYDPYAAPYAQDPYAQQAPYGQQDPYANYGWQGYPPYGAEGGYPQQGGGTW
mmetsp:Transcript_2605/g.5851  ORF Transcript_2605/g.5851 Transcript_2605/m.5851 type:complete len:302 (-) Transcript_2605:168-1073(-)